MIEKLTGGQRTITLTVVVGTDFEGAVSPHEKADGTLFFVSQEFDITRPALLPLGRVVLTGKTIQLCPPTKSMMKINVSKNSVLTAVLFCISPHSNRQIQIKLCQNTHVGEYP